MALVDPTSQVLRDELTNVKILNAIKNDSSLSYQQRVPDATQANLKETLMALDAGSLWNEFMHALLNRIGKIIVRNKVWRNPLREFKNHSLMYGSTIEEVAFGLVEAKGYSADRDYMEKDLFAQELVPTKMQLHKINRENFYKVTMNEAILRRAFLQGESALFDTISGWLNAPANSDAQDEFNIMCNLFNTFEDAHGFAKVQIPDLRTLDATGQDARRAIKTMQATAGEMSFLNTQYNAAGMPTHTLDEELVIFATPLFQANLNVEALAGAFNVDRMKSEGRYVTLPESKITIPGVQAIIADKSFFVVGDTLLETRIQPNAAGLYTNYFHHHHGIYSASPFANAVALTTTPQEVITVADAPVTSVAIAGVYDNANDGAKITTVDKGGVYQVKGEAVTTPASDTKTAVTWALDGVYAAHTRIDHNGILHIDEDEDAATVKVVASSIWHKEDVPFTASAEVTVNQPEPADPGV